MVGEVIGGLVDLASSVGNWTAQKQARQEQQRENDLTREREDNAIQRQANDYANAGFNRLQAIGGNGASASPVTVGGSPKLDTDIGTSTFKNYLQDQNNLIQLKQVDNQQAYNNGVLLNQAKQVSETVRHNQAMEAIQAKLAGINANNSFYQNQLREVQTALANHDYEAVVRGRGTSKQQESSYTTSSNTASSSSSDSFSADAGIGAKSGGRGGFFSSLFGLNAGVNGGEVNSSGESMTTTTRNFSADNQLGSSSIDYLMNKCESNGWKLSSGERTSAEKLYQMGMIDTNVFPTLDSYLVYRTLNKFQKQLGIYDSSVYGVNISESPATAGRR